MVMIDIFSSVFTDKSIKSPKPDFVAYCHDLAKQESAHINLDFLTTHFGFSFADLFDQTVARNKKILSALQSSPYCIIAHAGPEYDPDYSHVGVYLKNRYAFTGEIIDVISRDGKENGYFLKGSLDPALKRGDCASPPVQCIAFHLLTRFFQCGLADRGAVIIFEQPVIPILKYPNKVLRGQSRVDVFLFSRTRACRQLR